MIPLVLAVAFAGSFTPETACVEHDLQLMLSSPPAQSIPNRVELDRRIADVLFAEREVEARAVPGPRAWWSTEAAPVALALVGLALVLVATGRRSRGLAAVGAVAILGAGALAIAPVERARDLATRIAAIRTCRLRLNEVRNLIEHGEYAGCLHDIGEADEDLLLFQSTLQAGGQLKVEQIVKLRNEMNHRENPAKK